MVVRGRRAHGWATAIIAVVMAMMLLPAGARAGEWIQASCVNPNGSPAPSAGWTGYSSGNPGAGGTSTRCAPGTPMTAYLDWLFGPPYGGGAEGLLYTAPAGSTIVGGNVNVRLMAVGTGPSMVTDAALAEPASGSNDVIKQCAPRLAPCTNGTWSGNRQLPADQGGAVTASVSCLGSSSTQCDQTGSPNGDLARVQVRSADILLRNDSVPTGTNFSGGVFVPHASGTVGLLFTAADPGGPGVYRADVRIDGHYVYAATPDTEDGACVPVAALGAIMVFDWQQPCPASVPVDATVSTQALRDGRHRLQVIVTDAAGNVATVLDRTITTHNHYDVLTPRPHHRAVHVQLTLHWDFLTGSAWVVGVGLQRVPHGPVSATVHCLGHGCPAAQARGLTVALSALGHVIRAHHYRAGDRIYLRLTAPGLSPERAFVQIRSGKVPLAHLL
jgi:hypothetical protein